MNYNIKNKIKILIWSVFIIMIILYLFPINKYLKILYKIPYIDKIIHTTNFFILGLLFNLKFINNNKLILILFGLFIEILQGFFQTGRSFDIKDLIADTIGVLLTYPITKIFKK